MPIKNNASSSCSLTTKCKYPHIGETGRNDIISASKVSYESSHQKGFHFITTNALMGNLKTFYILRYVVPPTKDDNSCSKIQAITNLSSNEWDKLGRHLLGERESQLAKDEDEDE
ncbi:hypothetical protein SO802_029973 [Lithocarpus litseifolius]|uniref:Uncharacterized protein n=1 Tax=Lithocarpus litseifolius TaxID=425828 RepID=A0AAW2BY64_9ROSI